MTKFPTPSIDWGALSPELILLGGAAICLLVPLFLPHGWRRHFCAFVSILSFIVAGAAAIVLFQMDDTGTAIVADAVRRDRLAELAQVMIIGSGLLAVGVSYSYVLRERMGEYYTLLLTAAARDPCLIAPILRLPRYVLPDGDARGVPADATYLGAALRPQRATRQKTS